MDFPPAEGVRRTWADLPRSVKAEIEARLGARVVEAVSHAAGFSPGLASRLRTDDGQVVFVKAVSGVATPHSVAFATSALLARGSEFDVTVAQLDASDVQLEALGNPIIRG